MPRPIDPPTTAAPGEREEPTGVDNDTPNEPPRRSVDPIVIADDLCEILTQPPAADALHRCVPLLQQAGDDQAAVLAQLAARDRLSRLLPPTPSSDADALWLSLLGSPLSTDARVLLLRTLVGRSAPFDRIPVELLLLSALRDGLLGDLFATLIDTGLYDRLRSLLLCADQAATEFSAPLRALWRMQMHDRPRPNPIGTDVGAGNPVLLRALAQVRPTYGADVLNRAALAALSKQDSADFTSADAPSATTGAEESEQPNAPIDISPPFDLIIVPGFTPIAAQQPLHIDQIPAMQKRVSLAAQAFLDGAAPYVFLTGGSVHPPGTPYNEALMMRALLMDKGVSAGRIIVDPHARHTTTNLRNAGRLMLRHHLSRALIITGFEAPLFSQAFYLGHPNLSTFLLRCLAELGYSVGSLHAIDEHRILFRPAAACLTPDDRDPLDA